jgi:hypothetical protein
MFDLTNDSDKFRSSAELLEDGFALMGNHFVRGTTRFLPLYESKMIHIYDHRFGTYAGQTQAQANQGKLPELSDSEHADPDLVPMPANWVSEREAYERLEGRRTKYLIAFRDVTSAGSRRTFIPAVLPVAAVGNSAPLLFVDRVSAPQVACLLACLSSLAFDFLARLKAGGNHMNFFIVEQLPVLPPERFDGASPWGTTATMQEEVVARVLELVYTSHDLQPFAQELGFNGPPFVWNADRRSILTAQLDGLFLSLYGMDRDEAAYVLDRFPIVKQRDEALFGEFRTKRLVLDAYETLEIAAAGVGTT